MRRRTPGGGKFAFDEKEALLGCLEDDGGRLGSLAIGHFEVLRKLESGFFFNDDGAHGGSFLGSR